MNSCDLHLGIDYVGTSGIILSPEQKAALQTSLTILQSNMKFSRVYMWGKILGLKDDYFIAQGVEKDEFKERKFLYRSVVLKRCWNIHTAFIPWLDFHMVYVRCRLRNPPRGENLPKATWA